MKIYLDDTRDCPYSAGWVIARSADECIELLETGFVDELSLDHDLGEGKSGYDVIKWIEKEVYTNNFIPPQKMYCHSANPVGRQSIDAAIKKIQERMKKLKDNTILPEN